jgi:hypothetical protein
LCRPRRFGKTLLTSTLQMIQRLKDEYDGYHFSKDSEGLFNPFSLLNAFKQNELGRYWFRSGTPHALVEMLRRYQQRGKFDINYFENSTPVPAEMFESPLEAETGPLPLLYQAGYLTIKGCPPTGNKYILGIPNSEVRVGLMEHLLPLFSSFLPRSRLGCAALRKMHRTLYSRATWTKRCCS